MVEEDPIGSVKAIALAIINCDMVGKHFRACIWTARMKNCLLVLRRWSASEHFARGCLIEPGFQAGVPYCFKQSESAQSHDIRSELRHFETHFDVALRSEIID